MNKTSSAGEIKLQPPLNLSTTSSNRRLRNKKIGWGCAAVVVVAGVALTAECLRRSGLEDDSTQVVASQNQVQQTPQNAVKPIQPIQSADVGQDSTPQLTLSDNPEDVRTFLSTLGYEGIESFKAAIGPSVGTFTYGLVRDTFDGLQRAEFVYDAKATKKQNRDVYNATIFPIRYDDALVGPEQAAQLARAADVMIYDSFVGVRDESLEKAIDHYEKKYEVASDADESVLKVDKSQSEISPNSNDWDVPFSDYLVSTGFQTPVSLDNLADSSMDQKLTLRHIAALAEDAWFGKQDITDGDKLAAHRRNLSNNNYVATGETSIPVAGGTMRLDGGVYQVGKNLDMRLGDGQ